jgi:hypothetical protein
LTETIKDTVTGATFTHAYTINIPAFVGGNVGYVGFTSSNGFLTEKADVLTWTYQFTAPVGDEGGQLQRPGQSSAVRAAFGSLATAEMRSLQGTALRMQDEVLAAVFSQLAPKSGGSSPVAASATTSGGAAPPPSPPDVKAAWLQAVEALPAPKTVPAGSRGVVPDDSPDALLSTLDGRQELLNLFHW